MEERMGNRRTIIRGMDLGERAKADRAARSTKTVKRMGKDGKPEEVSRLRTFMECLREVLGGKDAG